ncbi:DUF6916 family protein [Rhodocista pekingensis]|uniref:DUF6916 family protein n=1 Tax=Rhodocista pekingensis TaxID=201185 RepID=A0ABW2L0L3_9PROT
MIVHGVDLSKLPLLTVEQFEHAVGRTFTLETVPEPVDVRLDSVRRFPKLSVSLREPFTAFFSSAPDVQLLEGLYKATLDGDTTLELYLIPVVAPPGRRCYQAVYN